MPELHIEFSYIGDLPTLKDPRATGRAPKSAKKPCATMPGTKVTEADLARLKTMRDKIEQTFCKAELSSGGAEHFGLFLVGMQDALTDLEAHRVEFDKSVKLMSEAVFLLRGLTTEPRNRSWRAATEKWLKEFFTEK